jgi:hypothetical protein
MDGLPGFDLDRRVTRGRHTGFTKRDAMLRDINALLAHADRHGTQVLHSVNVFQVKVTYAHKYDQLGREYARAVGSLPTLQGMGGGIRKTIAEGLYWDLDFEDCYNTILFAVAQHYEFPPEIIELLRELTQDKDTLRQEVARFYECNVKAAKNLLLKHWMGGRVPQWLKDFHISDDVCARTSRDGHHPIVPRLEDAAPKVLTLMLDKIAPLRPFLERVNEQRSRAHRAPKTEYTALSYGLQTIECNLLRETERQLAQLGYKMEHASKQFDGLYVWRDGRTGPFPQDQLDQITEALATFDVGGGLRVPMKLAEKDVKSPYSITQRVAQQAAQQDDDDASEYF